MTGVDVEHTKALEAAATPGPWLYCTKTYDGLPLVVAEGYGFPVVDYGMPRTATRIRAALEGEQQ